MSATQPLQFSVTQQRTFINATLNANLLFQFFFGVYTGVFATSLHIYFHRANRTASKDVIIIGNLSLLYAFTVLYMVLNLFYMNVWLCKDGGTRGEIFVEGAQEALPKGVTVSILISSVAGFVIADGLLVWRCFHACGRSLRRCFLPIGLWIVETVLVVSFVVARCLLVVSPRLVTAEGIRIFACISAAMYVAIATTSLVSTSMICREIYKRSTFQARSRGHYRNILEALIQSSAIYSVIVLFAAIMCFMNLDRSQSIFMVALIITFLDILTQISCALLPTLMVAQLFVKSAHENDEVPSADVPCELLPSNTSASANHGTVTGQLDLERQCSNGHIGAG
ncbi:hypothetical protein D9613_012760 [Agrocybe pediades]|uniref:Uncharacterized protein n=1 Tax=Agrocybe pediades TaxID=84607 RepID=A0A8H4QLG3_9AGAR|nr:hypothetical protein D9613_012760 [Agrocybe pediades]